MAETIALLNMKGGVGKTTLAFNLAWYLHKNEPANVLLIDLDPQFNATQCVMDFEKFEEHRSKKGTIADLLIDQPSLALRKKRNKKSPTAALYKVSETAGKRLDLLPSELGLAWAVKNPAQMDFRLEKLLGGLRHKYDYIIIDCAPTDSVLTTMALTASDHLIIPVRPDRFSILGFFNLIETINTFRANCPDPHGVKVLGIVFTQVTQDSEVEKASIAELTAAAKKEGTYVFTNHLKYSKSYIRSIKDQTPIFETQWAHHKPKTEVGKIAEEAKLRI
ncbi:MAG: ParA family protein [Terracidiphilus sp.]